VTSQYPAAGGGRGTGGSPELWEPAFPDADPAEPPFPTGARGSEFERGGGGLTAGRPVPWGAGGGGGGGGLGCGAVVDGAGGGVVDVAGGGVVDAAGVGSVAVGGEGGALGGGGGVLGGGGGFLVVGGV
jgi:hypothetical protein